MTSPVDRDGSAACEGGSCAIDYDKPTEQEQLRKMLQGLDGPQLEKLRKWLAIEKGAWHDD